MLEGVEVESKGRPKSEEKFVVDRGKKERDMVQEPTNRKIRTNKSNNQTKKN